MNLRRTRTTRERANLAVEILHRVEIGIHTLTFIKPRALTIVQCEHLPLAADQLGHIHETIHAALSPRYENRAIWHFYGGLCEDLEQELTQHNPAFDDIKDALHSVMGIIRVPTKRGTTRRRSNIITHSRFGGVAA